MHLWYDAAARKYFQVNGDGSMTPVSMRGGGGAAFAAAAQPLALTPPVAPVALPPPPTHPAAAGVCQCGTPGYPHAPHAGMVAYPPANPAGDSAGGELMHLRQMVQMMATSFLDMGERGHSGCQTRPPLQLPTDERGCSNKRVKCDESLSFGPVTISPGGILPITVVPFRSFQPQIFMWSGGPDVRFASVTIAGDNQLGSVSAFNPNNYPAAGNYNTVNWDDIESSVPVTIVAILAAAIVGDQIIEGEVKGPSIR